MEKIFEILVIFSCRFLVIMILKVLNIQKKKKKYETKKRISMKLNFVDFNIYGFKILKNLNILNIVKYKIFSL